MSKEEISECPTGEKNRDIIRCDILNGKGFCICLLPKTEFPEEVCLCWFDGDEIASDLMNIEEAADIGGSLVYAVTIKINEIKTKKVKKNA